MRMQGDTGQRARERENKRKREGAIGRENTKVSHRHRARRALLSAARKGLTMRGMTNDTCCLDVERDSIVLTFVLMRVANRRDILRLN